MSKIFYELQKLIKEQNLPEFPSFLPRECFTQEILIKYKQLYKCYLKRLLISKESNDNINSFADFIPLLYDFISIPLLCNDKDFEKLEELLQDEEEIGDDIFQDFANKDTNERNTKTDFKSAAGEDIKINEEKKRLNNNNNIDQESGLDQHIIDKIKNEILEKSPQIKWEDIAGLDNVKKSINEIVVWPILRPDIFKGLRNPPKGLLLFGPPGTGKTMIGKCIASQCKATFFSISASSLTSKWVGEGEKMVRALFFLARKMQPSVVFIDEIDSLLSQRNDGENEGSRRIKTEFLVQFDGAGTNIEDKILIIGATNRPHEIDEAARRRLVKRIYVPLPCEKAKEIMIRHLIKDFDYVLTDNDFKEISRMAVGYSGSDIYNLCREASMEPIREIHDITADNFNTRPISLKDFEVAMKQIRKSVSEKDLISYVDWNQNFGSV